MAGCSGGVSGMNEPDMFGQAVVELLGKISETWQEYIPDDLTDIQSQTLGKLVGAGMVEGRNQIRLRMHTHTVMADATIVFTGEDGFCEAIEPLVASLWTDWEESFRKWKDSDTSDAPSGHCERLEPSEWRLTDQGVQARRDIQGDQRGIAVDFVLKRGFFDGQPHLLPDGRVTRREAVPGYGKLVKMEKKQTNAADASENTGTVNLGNWDVGADALAKAFAPMFEKMFTAREISNSTPEQSQVKNQSQSDDPPKRAWTQPDLDKAIREYQAKRSGSFQQFVSLLDNPKTPASQKKTIRKEARAMFGRNIIAKALGVKSPKMVSQSKPWVAIAASLGLQLKRDQIGKYSGVGKKIGLDIAVEEASVNVSPDSDYAPADVQMIQNEQRQTHREIERFKNSGIPGCFSAADAIRQKYDDGEMTDEQVRQTIEMFSTAE